MREEGKRDPSEVVLEHVYIDPLIAKSLINNQEFSVMQKC